MANPYFEFPSGLNFLPVTLGRSAVMNARLAEIAEGFDAVYQAGLTTELPGQTGSAGKFITTNGTAASWSHLTDIVYAITDGASVVLDPGNGGIQTWTLGAARTCTLGFATGESMLLMVDDGTAYTLTITGVTWVGGSAPTLATSGYTVISLWMAGATVYGLHVGDTP